MEESAIKSEAVEGAEKKDKFHRKSRAVLRFLKMKKKEKDSGKRRMMRRNVVILKGLLVKVNNKSSPD